MRTGSAFYRLVTLYAFPEVRAKNLLPRRRRHQTEHSPATVLPAFHGIRTITFTKLSKIYNKSLYPQEKKKVGGVRYEARGRGRSTPVSLAF